MRIATDIEPGVRPSPGAGLMILYDERCPFCLRCRDWLATQPCLVEVELLAAGSEEAHERFGQVEWLGQELVVVDDDGNVWSGPAAFLMCLWATVRFRGWAYRFAQPGWSGHAETFFMHVSKRRDRWGAWFGRNDPPGPDCSYCDDVRMRRAP